MISPHQWADRIGSTLDVLSDCPSAFVIGWTRDPIHGHVLVYIDDPLAIFMPELARALSDDDTPAFNVVAFGLPSIAHYPLEDRPPTLGGVTVTAADVSDEDCTTVMYRPGEGWMILDVMESSDFSSAVRTRLWSLLLESAISHREER